MRGAKRNHGNILLDSIYVSISQKDARKKISAQKIHVRGI